MSQQAGASRKGSHPDAFFQSRGWWWTWVRTSVGCCGHTSNQWPCQALPVPTVQRCQQTVEGGLAGQSWGRSPTCSLWCPQWTPGRWVGGQGLFSYCHASCSLTLAEQAGEPISGGRWGQLRTVLQELPSCLVSLGSSQGHLDTSASIGDPNLLSPSQPEKAMKQKRCSSLVRGYLGLSLSGLWARCPV